MFKLEIKSFGAPSCWETMICLSSMVATFCHQVWPRTYLRITCDSGLAPQKPAVSAIVAVVSLCIVFFASVTVINKSPFSSLVSQWWLLRPLTSHPNPSWICASLGISLGMDTEPPAPMARMARSDPGGFLRRKMSWEADGIGGRGWNPEVPREKHTFHGKFPTCSNHWSSGDSTTQLPLKPWTSLGPLAVSKYANPGPAFQRAFQRKPPALHHSFQKKMSEDLRDSTIPVPGVQFQL